MTPDDVVRMMRQPAPARYEGGDRLTPGHPGSAAIARLDAEPWGAPAPMPRLDRDPWAPPPAVGRPAQMPRPPMSEADADVSYGVRAAETNILPVDAAHLHAAVVLARRGARMTDPGMGDRSTGRIYCDPCDGRHPAAADGDTPYARPPSPGTIIGSYGGRTVGVQHRRGSTGGILLSI